MVGVRLSKKLGPMHKKVCPRDIPQNLGFAEISRSLNGNMKKIRCLANNYSNNPVIQCERVCAQVYTFVERQKRLNTYFLRYRMLFLFLCMLIFLFIY